MKALRMNSNQIVSKYFDAWNQQDVTGLLDLMHRGAAYYDGFWMETCVGRDLAQYFRDALDEEPFWYMLVGDVLGTENGVVFRYSAHHREGHKIGDPILYGAEFLSILDGKILTVTDMYCSPNPSDLLEVAELAARRHGLTTHVKSGLGALKEARIKAGLTVNVDEEKVYLNGDITMSQLAETVGCTLDQLGMVIESQFDVRLEEFLDSRRVEHARELLEQSPDHPNIVEKVATSVGFMSVRRFEEKFTEIVGVTPAIFCSQQKHKKLAQDTPNLH